jgi:hypothetical protein
MENTTIKFTSLDPLWRPKFVSHLQRYLVSTSHFSVVIQNIVINFNQLDITIMCHHICYSIKLYVICISAKNFIKFFILYIDLYGSQSKCKVEFFLVDGCTPNSIYREAKYF